MLRLAFAVLTAAVLVSSSVIRPHSKLLGINDKSAVIYSPVGKCPPQWDRPAFLPDSKDCQKYYQCSNGVPVPKHCANGLQWNPMLNTCDFPEHANCQAGKPKAIHPFSPVGKCPPQQGDSPAFLPDSDDCHLYYECSNGVPVQNVCPGDLEWNPTLNTCDFPEHANCQVAKPEKTSRGIQPLSVVGDCPAQQGTTPIYLPDSEDCQKFYECSNGVPVPKHCPADLEWNPTLNTCDFPEHANCQVAKSEKASRSIQPLSVVGDCPAQQGPTPIYLPDSENCQKFYECSNGVPVPKHCPADLEWNPILNTCDFPEHANCQVAKPEKAPRSIQPLSVVGDCPAEQGPTPVYLPDDEDCSAFYECSNGEPIKLHCAPGSLFDSNFRRCVSESEANCQGKSVN